MNLCSLEESLKEVISQELIQSVFQPIVDVRLQQVIGYEALSRGPSNSPLYGANVLFETAERANLLDELESLCRKRALERFKNFSIDGRLFINVSPQSLIAPVFSKEKVESLINQVNVDPANVVIELSERYPSSNMQQTLEALSYLKSKGFKIAIDDLGTGYSGLKLWSEVKPDFVKIDRHFVRDIDTDLVKREFVHSVIGLANGIGCQVIAEGVETEAEYRTIFDLGIDLCQGFYFGKPKAFPTVANLTKLQNQPSQQNAMGKVGVLSIFVEPVSSNTTLREVATRFGQSGYISAIPVVDNGRPLGMISKWRLLEIFSSHFGQSLHENKPVSHYMTHNTILVTCNEDLYEVSRLLTSEEDLYIRQHFIITYKGLYHGLGSTRDVLRSITDIKRKLTHPVRSLALLPNEISSALGNGPRQETK